MCWVGVSCKFGSPVQQYSLDSAESAVQQQEEAEFNTEDGEARHQRGNESRKRLAAISLSTPSRRSVE